MCTSPEQMTSERIEGLIKSYENSLGKEAAKDSEVYAKYIQRKIEQFSGILKERADNGTYDTAGYHKGDRHETHRTAYQEA